MKSFSWRIQFTLLLAGLTLPSQSTENPGSKNVRDHEAAAPFHGSSWRRQGSRDPFSRKSMQQEDDGVGLDGLSPVRVEMGPGDWGFSLESSTGIGSPTRDVDEVYARSSNREAAALAERPASRKPVATAMPEHPPTRSPTSTKSQKTDRGNAQGEVLPTLDMALFDWTDYEDMKPEDSWPSTKKKDKKRSKNMSSGNVTVNADDVEPCDHHLDCLPGSCCDLRHHECKPHNRGLNNKCYDDCMCEE
ncbi:draxin-B, partial [Clarias magur]